MERPNSQGYLGSRIPVSLSSEDSVSIEQRFIDKLGCRVYQTSAQTVVNATVTKVTWDEVNYDHRSEVDLANNKIVVSNAGLYMLKHATKFVDTIADGTDVVGLVEVNGSVVAKTDTHTGKSDYVTAKVMDVRELSGGDEVEFYVYQDSSASVDTKAAGSYATFGLVTQLG